MGGDCGLGRMVGERVAAVLASCDAGRLLNGARPVGMWGRCSIRSSVRLSVLCGG